MTVSGSRRTVHTPCAVDEFELTVLDKAAGQVTTLVWLLVPPPSKEANLNVCAPRQGLVCVRLLPQQAWKLRRTHR